MKKRIVGIILIVLGFGAITAGIILKRMFFMGQYLFYLHTTGGFLLALGASVLFLGKEKERL